MKKKNEYINSAMAPDRYAISNAANARLHAMLTPEKIKEITAAINEAVLIHDLCMYLAKYDLHMCITKHKDLDEVQFE